MYHRSYTTELAYRQFVKAIQSRSKDDLEFHKFLADRSVAPRRRDFNRFYKDFKDERFGAKDLKTILVKLGEKVKELRESDENMKAKLNEFNEEENEPLIVIVVTPLMMRVHETVSPVILRSLLYMFHYR